MAHQQHSLRRPIILAICIASILILMIFTVIGSQREQPSSEVVSLLGGQTIRLLVVGDPFVNALREILDTLEQQADGTIDLEVVSYDDVRQLTLLNARDVTSAYDIVSFDVVWVGEYGANNVLLPLDELIAADEALAADDFLTIAYRGSQYKGYQLGLPIQPHPELLWYRRDLFAAAQIPPPQTTDEILAAARQLMRPEQGRYGICWNGQRGQALGQQMAHFYAAFGQPLLDEHGRPALNSAGGIAAAHYARALLEVSPPDVLNMAWDQRPQRFGRGDCVMTYEWGARSYIVEENPNFSARGVTGYLPAPHSPDVAPVTPLGTWSLGIPANIGPRRELAWHFLAWLSSPNIQRLLAEHGNGGMPRRSLLKDPALVGRYPTFPTVAELDRKNQLADWMRPSIPQWAGMAEILGTVYHDMLRGVLSPEEAAAEAQRRAEELFPR